MPLTGASRLLIFRTYQACLYIVNCYVLCVTGEYDARSVGRMDDQINLESRVITGVKERPFIIYPFLRRFYSVSTIYGCRIIKSHNKQDKRS